MMGKYYNLRLEDGSTVEAWRPDDEWHPQLRNNFTTEAYIEGRKNLLYWCHGYTFGTFNSRKGPFSVTNDKVDKVLKGDGWKRIKCGIAQREDIAVWNGNAGPNSHSAKILRMYIEDSNSAIITPNEDKSLIIDKRGGLWLNRNPVSLKSAIAEYGGTYRCYSKENRTSSICIGKGEHESWSGLE